MPNKKPQLSKVFLRSFVGIGLAVVINAIFQFVDIREYVTFTMIISSFWLLAVIKIWLDYQEREKADSGEQKGEEREESPAPIKAPIWRSLLWKTWDFLLAGLRLLVGFAWKLISGLILTLLRPSESWQGVKLVFKIITRYLTHPIEFVRGVLSLIVKPFHWLTSFQVLFSSLVTGALWLGIRFYEDSKWDAPHDYSQVVQLSNLFGFQKDELTIGWHHFGDNKSDRETPYTLLLAVDFGDSMVSLSRFEERYMAIEPDSLPRNDLEMSLRSLKPDFSLRDCFEAIVKDHPQVKKVSGFMSNVYSIDFNAKTQGSEQHFTRRFHFRTSTLFERVLVVVLVTSFALFFVLFINFPPMPATWKLDTKAGLLIKEVRRRLLEFLDNALNLREPIYEHAEPIKETLGAIIGLHICSGRDDKPEIIDSLQRSVKNIENSLDNACKPNKEIITEVKERIELIFIKVRVIYYRRILVLETKKEFDDFVRAMEEAEQRLELSYVSFLEPTVEKQISTLNDICDRLNKERDRLRKVHLGIVAEEARKRAEKLASQLQHVPIFIESASHPIRQTDIELGDSIGLRVRRPLGEGYKGVEFDFTIPELVVVVVKWEGKMITVSASGSPLTEISIPAKSLLEEDVLIRYHVLMEPFTFDLDRLPQLNVGTMKLKPINEKQLDALYRPLTVEEMKELGLVDFMERKHDQVR